MNIVRNWARADVPFGTNFQSGGREGDGAHNGAGQCWTNAARAVTEITAARTETIFCPFTSIAGSGKRPFKLML